MANRDKKPRRFIMHPTITARIYGCPDTHRVLDSDQCPICVDQNTELQIPEKA